MMEELFSYITSPATIVNIIAFVFGLGVIWANFNAKQKELDRRVSKIEGLDLDSRLTRMEANLDWIRTTLEKLDRLHNK